MNELLQKTGAVLFSGGQIDRDTALALAGAGEALYRLADEVRRHFMGNRFDLCAIINAKSGGCTEDCRFCAQSARHHTGAARYAIVDRNEALDMAKASDRHGVERLGLVTSGRSLSARTVEQLSGLLKALRAETGLYFCSSVGLMDERIAGTLVSAGVRRCHCNLEACRSYFPRVCSTHTWEEKVATLQLARAHGMTLCSGGIIGMGESLAERVDLALELRALGVKSIPVNVLTPIPGTPLGDVTPLTLDEVLTAIALFRLINPDAVVRMCGGRQQLGEAQYRCFSAGANGAIVGNYLTTNGNELAEDLAQIRALGFSFAREAAHA